MDQDKRKQISDLNKLASTIIQDPIYSNKTCQFIESLSNLDPTKSDQTLYNETVIRCVGKIFNFYIDSREMVLSSDTVDQTWTAINQYRSHLIQWYDIVLDELLSILRNEGFSLDIRKLSLITLIKFVEEEGKFPFRPLVNKSGDDDDQLSFPKRLLTRIIESLISETNYNQELISIYATYYQFDDFIHFTLKTLSQLIDTTYNGSENSYIMQNIIDFIFPIRLIPPTDLLPKSLQTEIKVKKKKRQKTGITGEHKTWIRLCQMQPYSDPKNHVPIKLPTRKFKFDYERDAELYSNLWIKYLRFKLAPVTYKRVLVYLDKYAIQHFSNPLLLADFLINSFKTGGIISLLSLSPLYILIGKCNLEYPNFYDQLYQLVEPAIVYVKYRPRFLFWCDLFLTSTHISANIAASFVKLMARLALSSPPDTILVLLPFIGNLLIRNPAIQSMLIAKQFDPENDPFNSDEPIPTKTNAINSYLWELKALQSHFLPSIAEMAKKIATNLPTHEWDLSDILETDMDDVMEKATKSMMKSDKFTYDLACDLFYSL